MVPYPAIENDKKGNYYFFFLTRLRKKRLRQKRCARGKLVGVEEEIFWKSYKLKVWHRFQNHNFITYKEGRLTSNLGLKNVGYLTFCISGVLSNIFGFTKKLFFKTQKKLPVEHKFVVKQKKMNKGHITGHRKNFNKKKSKLAFTSKK